MKRGAAAFTFVELIMAVFISSLVLMAIYLVFITSTDHFYDQKQVVQLQEGMRFAMEYIKSDLRNAGRLSIVEARDTPERDPGLCQVQDLSAVQIEDNNIEDLPKILTESPNAIKPDRLRLLVENSGALPLYTQEIFQDRVILAPAAQQTTLDTRDFLSSPERLEDAFQEGFFLYISNPLSNQTDLVPIKSINGDTRSIILDRITCINTLQCTGGCTVNPVQLIEYSIQGDEDKEDERTVLRRSVLDARNGDPIERDGMSLTIAEYVIDLQIWGNYDSRAVGAQVPLFADDPNPQDDIGNWKPAPASEEQALNFNNRRIRSLNLLLAVRTPREDEGFTLAPRYDDEEKRVPMDRIWFDLDKLQSTGLARVATLHGEVHTPNLYRGL